MPRPYRIRTEKMAAPSAPHATAVVLACPMAKSVQPPAPAGMWETPHASNVFRFLSAGHFDLSMLSANYGRVCLVQTPSELLSALSRPELFEPGALQPEDPELKEGPIDLYIIAPGDRGRIITGSEDIDTDWILGSALEVQRRRLRIAYSVADFGASLGAAWMSLGFKAHAGPSGRNFYPTRIIPFIMDWVGGSPFGGCAVKTRPGLESISLSMVCSDAIATHGRMWLHDGFDSSTLDTVLGSNAAARAYGEQRWGLKPSPTLKSTIDEESSMVSIGDSPIEIDSDSAGNRAPGPTRYSKRSRTLEGIRR